jgi:hypothetical protein
VFYGSAWLSKKARSYGAEVPSIYYLLTQWYDMELVLLGLGPARFGSAQHQLIQIGTSGAEPDRGLRLERLRVDRIWVIPF